MLPATEPFSSNLDKILQKFEEEYKSKTDHVIMATPPTEMWRYYIDYPANSGLAKNDMKHIGWLSFTENNYLKGLTKAFHLMLTTDRDSSNSADDLIKILLQLQKTAVTNVINKDLLGFCDYPMMIYQLIDKHNTTPDGFNELLENIKNDISSFLILETHRFDVLCHRTVIKHPNQTKSLLRESDNVSIIDVTTLTKKDVISYYKDFVRSSRSAKCQLGTVVMQDGPTAILAERESHVKVMIEMYLASIAAASNKQDVLTAIAILTTNMVKYHPFNDGNARSIAILFLNFLLKENGFPPAIINPNFSGGYSHKQWENEILSGMERALELAHKANLPCISTELILENAEPTQVKNFQDAVKIESLNRTIRQLHTIPINELVELLKDQLDKFIYENELTDKDISSINRVCDKIKQLKDTEVNGFEIILNEEIQATSSNTSDKFFGEPIDKKLQEIYCKILATANKTQQPTNAVIKK